MNTFNEWFVSNICKCTETCLLISRYTCEGKQLCVTIINEYNLIANISNISLVNRPFIKCFYVTRNTNMMFTHTQTHIIIKC